MLLLASQSAAEIADTLRALPSGLEAEDIEDFCSLARYYAAKTPPSFRKVSKLLFLIEAMNPVESRVLVGFLFGLVRRSFGSKYAS